jgi:hypothetical protein
MDLRRSISLNIFCNYKFGGLGPNDAANQRHLGRDFEGCIISSSQIGGFLEVAIAIDNYIVASAGKHK